MKKRIESVFMIIIGVLMVMFCVVTKSQDAEYYNEAKQTTATIEKITQKEKKVYRKRGKVRRQRTVVQYTAHISYEAEQNGELIPRMTTLRDVSSNLKEGDEITIFYKGSDVRIRTEDQSNNRNAFVGVFGVFLFMIGAVSYKLSKSNSEYDELSGEDNIYNERHNDYTTY